MGFLRWVARAGIVCAAVTVTGVVPSIPAHAAAGDGLRDMSSAGATGSCTGTDAGTADWSWTKPGLEYSTDGGATYRSAAGSQWGMIVCRAVSPVPQYWFTVGPSTGAIKDMGSAGLAAGLQFRVTITPKPGDNATYAVGYSSMVSFVDQGSSVVVVAKAAAVSKTNFTSWQNFIAAHSECSTYTMETWTKCSITKSDEDLTTIIQYVGYSATTLTSMEQDMKGLWIGANVNSFRIGMSCTRGASAQGVHTAEDITVGGKTYTRLANGNFRGPDGTEYTQSQLSALMGSSGSGSDPSLTVSMEGTPHFRADGVTLNRGSMKAFVPATIARKCFGKSDGSSTLSSIAAALSVSRQETKEGTSSPQFTVEAVTSPVEGLLVTVADMTFSNPEYTIKSTLSAYMAGAGSSSGTTTGGTSSGSTSSGSTSSYSISKKGSKATLKIVLGSATTVKIYLKTKGVAKLIKSLSGKKGTNTYVTTWKSGYSFIIRSKTGTQLAVLK